MRSALASLRQQFGFWNWVTLGAALLFFLLLVWPLINLVLASFAPARATVEFSV